MKMFWIGALVGLFAGLPLWFVITVHVMDDLAEAIARKHRTLIALRASIRSQLPCRISRN